MEYKEILISRADSSSIVTLNRPEKRNAISIRMMAEIISAVQDADSDRNVRCIIITGGQSFFSSGADLTEIADIRTPSDGVSYFRKWQRLNESIENANKPVIAAIEGFCVTGGCELTLSCDMRVAAEGSTFAITSSRIGTIPGAGGTQRLPRVVGIANALDMLFSGEPIDVEVAYKIGLINRKTERGKALDKAISMATAYSNCAPLSLSFVKRAVYQGMQMDRVSAIEMERFMATAIYGTHDKHEGVAAFLEKRKPRFQGN